MRNVLLLALLFTLVGSHAAWAAPEVSVRQWVPQNSGLREAGARGLEAAARPMLLAQETETAEPEPLDRRPTPGIFENLQIDLLDLRRMSDDLEDRLTGETVRLTLEDCVRIALEGNQDIIIVSYEPLKSQADVMSAKGDFDPVLAGTFNFDHSTSSASAQIRAFGGITNIEANTINGQLDINGRTMWGTQYNIGMNLNRDRGTFTGFFKEYGSQARVSLTQPLLRGFGKNANLFRIRSAKLSLEISETQVQLQVLNTIGDVVKAYWDLVGTIENLRVREESLANAENLLRINERRVEIGVAAPIEVIQSKAGVATRQSDLITARSAIADAEDVLKQLLNMQDGAFFSSNRIVPIDRPGVQEFEWDEARSMTLAVENRPEIRSAELELETSRYDEKRARNDLLPQVDFGATWTQGGRNFNLRDTLRGVRSRQDTSYNFNLTVGMPLGNRTGRGAHRRARLTVRQSERRVEQAKQTAMLGVRMAARGVLTSEILVESNRQARTFQEANVAAEVQRLQLGVSTSHTVLQIQEDLTLAQTQEVQSIVNFEKSLVDLRVAEGSLLSNMNVVYEVPDLEPALPYGSTFNPYQMWKTWQGESAER